MPVPIVSSGEEEGSGARPWPVEKAQAWYAQQPWLVGCNFIPSTAVNQLEMWQADTFDPDTIDQRARLGCRHGTQRGARLPARPGL